MQSSMTIPEYALRVLDAWYPKLDRLKKLYPNDNVRLFPGLFAFFGIQLCLWQIWLKFCAEDDIALDDANCD